MNLSRLSLFSAMTASLLGLAACNEQGGSLPRNGRHYVPIAFETQNAMREKDMRTHAPIMIRAFKQESELEVWKQDSSGKMALLKTYPMCRWSGQLGPKIKEGDRQVPEGFYAFSPGAMNPNSNFYLSFNVGYPNQLDRQLGRTGNLIMVHGDCSSAGCYAMTDAQVADIYGLTREAFAGGQSQIQVQSLPFRMTAENLAKYRNDPNMPFWKNLKQGNDYFEVARAVPKVSICKGRYAFNTGSDGCAPAEGETEIMSTVASKNRQDEIKVAELISKGTRAVKRVYRDGDMHPVFKETAVAQANGLTNRSIGTTRNGVSRTDSLAFTPIELPVEQYNAHRSKGRSPLQIAELVQQERLNEALSAQSEGTAKSEPAKAAPAIPAILTASAQPAKPAAASNAPAKTDVAIAKTDVASAKPETAIALAAAPAEAPQKSVFQRMLGSVGLSGQEEAKIDETKVQEIARTPVTIPLPPRRQAAAPAGPTTPQPGPQAATGTRLPDIISDTQRLAPSSLAGSGFSKLP